MNSAYRVEDLGQYRPKLIRFAKTRLFNPVHAEDAVQETLLAAIEGLHSFTGGSSLFSWLTGILKHKMVDCVRRTSRDDWHEIDSDGTPLNSGESDICWAPSQAKGFDIWGDPEHLLARRQRAMALERCVRDLPERTAETFVLREVFGFSTTQVCQVLTISETNCSVMLHRARNRIRETFDPDWIAL